MTTETFITQLRDLCDAYLLSIKPIDQPVVQVVQLTRLEFLWKYQREQRAKTHLAAGMRFTANTTDSKGIKHQYWIEFDSTGRAFGPDGYGTPSSITDKQIKKINPIRGNVNVWQTPLCKGKCIDDIVGLPPAVRREIRKLKKSNNH